MTIRSIMLGTAAALSVALPALAQDSELLVFDWAGFEDPGIHVPYTEKYGMEPTYSFYGDDEEAFQKVSSGFKPDIAHPCAPHVQKYRDAGLIEPWDTSKIAAFASLDPEFLNSPVFKDEGGVWFLPVDWGATAVAWNKDEVPPEDVVSLQVFTNPKYLGRISLPDSNDDVWALAYLATGVTDWSIATEEQFLAAAAWLRSVHPNVRAYWADPSEMGQLMATGEVLVALSWPEGVRQLVSDGYNVGFKQDTTEGTSRFFCGFVNFKDGPGVEEKAYDYVNAWYADSSVAYWVETFGYGSANLEAMAKIPAEKLTDLGLGPVSVPLLMQQPMNKELRARMVEEFEKIKAGF